MALFLSLFIVRKNNYIAFGSWKGEQYSDNSKYMLEYIRSINDGTYKLFWVGNERVRELIPRDVVFVKKNSFVSIFTLLQCKYMFFSQMHNSDICSFNVFRNATTIFLDHGIGVKKWAMDAVGYHGELEIENVSLIKRFNGIILGTYIKYSYFVSSSDFHYSTYLTACKYVGANENNVLRTGTPRNDVLVNATEESIVANKEKYADLIGFDKKSKIIMYLPTFRRKVKAVRSLVNAESGFKKKLIALLKKYNAIIIEKNHFAADLYEENCNKSFNDDRLIKLDVDVDLQEMLQFADIQISDYSGSFIDYLHLDKPIIHYAYDYEYYRDNDSGLYLEINDFAAGDIAYNDDELLSSLEKALSGNDERKELRKRAKELFVSFEDGTNCEKIFTEIILKQ